LKHNPRGSELMANNDMFTSVFGGGSSGSSDKLPVENTLPVLWFGYHIPVVYKLCTGCLPPAGGTFISYPEMHAQREKQRAYARLALFQM
jgi:hypothetical protein